MTKARILLVEDEVIVARSIKNRLNELGYDVCAIVSSGKEAVARAVQLKPDLVLMDIVLDGDMDGVQAAEEIRTRLDVPVIYLTAHTDNGTLQRAKLTEPFGYIVKPFEAKELLSTVEIALYKHAMERKLKESEKKLKTQYKGIPIPTYTWQRVGEDFVLIDYNDAAEVITQGKIENYLGKTAKEMYVDNPAILEDISRCFAEKTAIEREMIYRFKSTNETKHLAVKYAFVPPDLILVHTEDITRRKLAEEELKKHRDHLEVLVEERTVELRAEIAERKQAEKKLRRINQVLDQEHSMFIAGPVVVFKWKNQEGWPVEYVSANVKEVFGYTAEEWTLGKVSYAKIIMEDDIDRVVIEVKTCSESGARNFQHEPYRIICKDGKTIWLDDFTTILRDEAGNITHYLGYVVDITERKRAEQALLKEKRFSESVVASLPGIFYLFDEKGGMLQWNENFEKISGYSGEELAKMNVFDFFAGEGKKIMKERVSEVFAKGESTADADFITRSGKSIPHFFTGLRTQIDDTVYLVGVGVDITERKRAEEALAESVRRNEALLQAMPDMMFVLTRDGIYTDFRADRDEDLAIPPEEIIGKSLRDAGFSVDYVKLILELIEETLTTGKTQLLEYDLQTPKGLGSYEARLVPLNEDEVLATVRDITERKQAEQALKDSEVRYRAFTEDAQVGVYVYRDGHFLFVNPAMERITGYSRNELLEMETKKLQDLDDPKTPEIRKQEDKNIHEYSMRILRKNGDIAVLEFRTRPIVYEGGEAVLGNCIDVTERVHQQEQIELAKQEWERTFDAIEDQVVILDRDYRILRANRPVAEYLGLSFQQLVGRPCYELFQREAVCLTDKCPHTHCIKTRSPVHYESKDLRTGRDFSVYASPMLNKDGEVIAVVEVARDVTKRKLMEQQLLRSGKLASIGVLAAGIAHQVNNPLATMLLTVDTFRDLLSKKVKLSKKLQDKIAKYLDTMETEIESTRDVVSSLLTFTRSEVAEVQPTDVNLIVRKTIKLTAQHLDTHSFVLETSFDKKLSAAFIDPAALQEVLVNVIQNAYDAVNGSGRVVIRTETGENEMIRIVVSDNGTGVPEHIREKIFEPLFSTKTTTRGTGLGLSIATMLLARFGSRIYLADTSSDGATFVIEVPIVKEEE